MTLKRNQRTEMTVDGKTYNMKVLGEKKPKKLTKEELHKREIENLMDALRLKDVQIEQMKGSLHRQIDEEKHKNRVLSGELRDARSNASRASGQIETIRRCIKNTMEKGEPAPNHGQLLRLVGQVEGLCSGAQYEVTVNTCSPDIADAMAMKFWKNRQ